MSFDKIIPHSAWKPITKAFTEWLKGKEHLLEPGLSPEPTIKVMTFLALLDAEKPCSYDDLRVIFLKKAVIEGKIPDNTLRTSVLNLGRTLEKCNHHLELKSFRGRFQLISRKQEQDQTSKNIKSNSVLFLTDSSAITAQEIATSLVEKVRMPFQGLYFLEWSARWWESYSNKEAEIRSGYESASLEKLGILNRLIKGQEYIGILGLAPGEGVAELEILRKLLSYNSTLHIHYLAIDSSTRLLRDHLGLLQETFSSEIAEGRLICGGIVADIFHGLRQAIFKAKKEFYNQGLVNSPDSFLSKRGGILVTYLGNCLGNNFHDQEADFFSIIHSTVENRPLEVLVGVSIQRESADIYKRNWDDFLLQTPRHLLETKKLLKSNKPPGSQELPEFILPQGEKQDRCPNIYPEPYIARHQIKGQIYRFYYQLAYDLELASKEFSLRPLPKGSLLLLYNIIKYDIQSLVNGIKKCGLFNVSYDYKYHQIIHTENGAREYAVFSTYIQQ